MSNSNLFHSVVMAGVFAISFAATGASAEPDQRSGKRRGPPPEAIQACNDQAEGALCSFTGRRGEEISGTCIVPPRDQELLACAPEGGPPRDHQRD